MFIISISKNPAWILDLHPGPPPPRGVQPAPFFPANKFPTWLAPMRLLQDFFFILKFEYMKIDEHPGLRLWMPKSYAQGLIFGAAAK